jgi:hypothetical protein
LQTYLSIKRGKLYKGKNFFPRHPSIFVFAGHVNQLEKYFLKEPLNGILQKVNGKLRPLYL